MKKYKYATAECKNLNLTATRYDNVDLLPWNLNSNSPMHSYQKSIHLIWTSIYIRQVVFFILFFFFLIFSFTFFEGYIPSIRLGLVKQSSLFVAIME